MVTMTGLQIKAAIDQLNSLMETLLNPSVFTVNNEVIALTKEIETLQNQCPHSFVEGYCEYCYKREGENN